MHKWSKFEGWRSFFWPSFLQVFGSPSSRPNTPHASPTRQREWRVPRSILPQLKEPMKVRNWSKFEGWQSLLSLHFFKCSGVVCPDAPQTPQPEHALLGSVQEDAVCFIWCPFQGLGRGRQSAWKGWSLSRSAFAGHAHQPFSQSTRLLEASLEDEKWIWVPQCHSDQERRAALSDWRGFVPRASYKPGGQLTHFDSARAVNWHKWCHVRGVSIM